MIIPVAQIEVFFFILARIIGIFIQAPIFSSRTFPSQAKLAFAVWISIVLWFVVPVFPNLPTGLVAFIFTLAAEVALGFTLGFLCHILFIAVQSAGEIMDMQMGLSVATALDPVFGAVISVVGKLAFFMALIVFLSFDGHLLILSAFHQSFSLLPAGKIANFSSPAIPFLFIETGKMLWTTAVKLAAPIILLIFIVDFSFGIVSRVAPQVNVFMLGFQVKPMMGLFGIMLTLPLIARYVGKIVETMAEYLIQLTVVLK